MTPVVKNLTIYQGSRFRYPMRWLIGPNLQTLTPVDLTGYTARLQVRDGAGNLLLDLTTENGGITLGGVLGTIVLLLTTAQTTALTWDVGTYHLEMVQPDLEAIRLMGGRMQVSQEIAT